MAKKTFHFPGFSVKRGDIKADVKLDRFEKSFQEAQYWLDGEIMTDMVPFMPHRDGTFINSTKLRSAAIQGSGKVIAGAPPFGRYLYEGKVMVDSETGKGPAYIPGVGYRFRSGARLVATGRSLNYSNPQATSHWFDTAKKKYGESWVKGVKEIAGGK